MGIGTSGASPRSEPAAEPLQHAGAVRLYGDAGADLGERRGLLVETHLHAALKQCVGGRDPTDAAADNRDA